MITEEKLKEGFEEIKKEMGRNLDKLVEAINHEQYEDAFLITAELNLGLTATLITTELLNGDNESING